ncbi:Co-chaperone [Marasmius crinis-equi]|uniref:Co-chaperone n=1 Tax=Marasmius crinis-equi TaxID=585013 RepID=A0ABR3F2E1_9AGAR
MALPSSTANWHWKNKNVTKWGKEWFEKELQAVRVKGEKEGEELSIADVREVDGDIELGQRKSKLITIYDCKVTLAFEGTCSDGTSVQGTIHIPEVSHEITVDKTSDYSYYWAPNSTNAASEALITQMRKLVPPILEEIFARFPVAMIDTHGRDLTVSADPSRAGTPTPGAPAAAASASASTGAAANSAAAKPAVKKAEKALNTSTVEAEATLVAAADDLFSLLTDEKRIPMWTRAPAQSAAKPDTEYTLFGGGVKGKYISLEPSKKIVQTWALSSPTWPEGHTATLTTTLDQSSESTKVTWVLEGVPKGQEDEIKRNLEGYYIHGLKSIGYVQLFPSPPTPARSSPRKKLVKSKPTSESTSTSTYCAVGLFTVLVVVAAFSIPLFGGSPSKR